MDSIVGFGSSYTVASHFLPFTWVHISQFIEPNFYEEASNNELADARSRQAKPVYKWT